MVKLSLANKFKPALKLAIIEVILCYINLAILILDIYTTGNYQFMTLFGCMFAGLFAILLLYIVRHKNYMYTWESLKEVHA